MRISRGLKWELIAQAKKVSVECFHSRDQWVCFRTKIKDNICISIEFNSRRISWGHHPGCCSFVQENQHGRRDVTWKHSISTASSRLALWLSLDLCPHTLPMKHTELVGAWLWMSQCVFLFSKTDEDSQLQIRFVITLLERDFHERLKSAG